MKKWISIIITIILVLVADLVTKHFLFDVEYFNLIPNVLSIATNGGNDGGAWGIMSGKVLVLIIITFVMLIAFLIFNYFAKYDSMWYNIAFGLIFGGAVGNLIDRLALHYVRDFIFLDFFPSFPVFNIADSCLCVGAVMLAIFILFKADKSVKK